MHKLKPYLRLSLAFLGCCVGNPYAQTDVLQTASPENTGGPMACGPGVDAPVGPRVLQAPPAQPADVVFPSLPPTTAVLGIVCDKQCLAWAGSKAKFEADLHAIMLIAQGYYQPFNVTFQLNPVYYVEDAQNPWQDVPTSYSSNASNFRQWAAAKYPAFHNMALLFTGQKFSGIDYARVGHVCANDSYRYGQIDYSYDEPLTQRANLTTHELGHILGAQHAPTSRTVIMSPVIYDGVLTWDQTAVDSISKILVRYKSCFNPIVSILPNVPAASAFWESLGNGEFRLLGEPSSHPVALSIWNLQGRMSRQITLERFSDRKMPQPPR